MAHVDAGFEARSTVSDQPRAGASGEAGWESVRQSQSTRRQTYRAHDVIYFEGDDARHLYEIVTGGAMLYKLLPDGRRQVVEVLGPGDLFGFDMDAQHDCSAETLVATTLMVFNRSEIERSSAAQSHLTRCALQQVCAMHEHAVLLGRKSAYERVATFLMRFVPERGTVNCKGPDDEDNDTGSLRLNMTRQEMADYLGLTIETVSRVISDMKRKGVIRLEKHDQITINRICSLCQLTGTHAD
ncbi:MAG: helix-turn-helix domain-containing protein [Devosiaceae bacterium]|nr:helix-turn-helix domain-containing protein [Devosiaceae bacterium MH13]